MKKTHLLPALLSLLGTSWAVTKNPSEIKLKWLEDEVIDGDTLPHMEITFADGTTDEIFLKPDLENACFYHGTLKSDIESEVEVDGCRGDAEIVEISSRLVPCGLVILLLENGETYKINPFEGIAFPNGTDTVPPTAAGFNGASSWQGALPTTAVAKIHVRYDRSLKDMFDGSESKARQKVLAIIHLARPRFKRSLGLSMNIEIEIQSIQYYNSRLPHAHSSGALRSLSGRGGGGGHSTAWFRAAQGNTAAGIAHLQGLCDGESGLITDVWSGTYNDAGSALLFAHELGHNLGMQHDFHYTHSGRDQNLNRDSMGHYGPCNDKGIMSYQPPQELPPRWSDCSRKDQDNTFKSNTHRCMASGGGGGGPPPASGCRCNGRVVQSGRYQGAGSCDWGGSVSCGSFCFVDRGTCREEFRITGFENYGYASCTPCPNSRNAPALKTAECPSTGSSIGKEVGFLAAGLLMALVI